MGMKARKQLKPVLVTTVHRGVFFGYTDNWEGDRIKLERARLVVYWDASCKGFMGLAANGPGPKCRIGPSATITVRDITAVAEVTPEAVTNFELAPWG